MCQGQVVFCCSGVADLAILKVFAISLIYEFSLFFRKLLHAKLKISLENAKNKDKECFVASSVIQTKILDTIYLDPSDFFRLYSLNLKRFKKSVGWVMTKNQMNEHRCIQRNWMTFLVDSVQKLTILEIYVKLKSVICNILIWGIAVAQDVGQVIY